MTKADIADLPQDAAVAYLAQHWNLTDEMARRRWERESDSYRTVREQGMKAAALWYARNGIPVFPLHWPTKTGCSCGKKDCHSPGKHPRTPNGFKDATKDVVKIAEWWD